MNNEVEKLKAELAEARADIRQFMRNFEFCNMVLPHALWLAADVDKMLRGEPNFVKQSLENYHHAVKHASEDADKNELRCEERWKDEKRDIAKRLGYPDFEPWCAADDVVKELVELFKLKGYSVVKDGREIRLVKNDEIIHKMWIESYDKTPDLSHPEILEAIHKNEKNI